MGRQPHNPNLARTPVGPLREREGVGFYSSFCIKRLLPYFFIAGHHNYARYLSWHCLEMSIDDGITCPSIDSGPPGPPLLMNVISYCCRAKDKACKEGNCSCYHEKLSCTIYCICTAGDECCNPFTKKEEMEKNNDQHDHDYDDDCVDRDAS